MGMRKPKKELEWYAFNHDFNSDKLYQFNVIRDELIERIMKYVKNCKKKELVISFDNIKEEIRRELMYHYWSKCEYEVAITGLFTRDPEKWEKKDVWYQLEPNLDRIVEYIIKELKIDTEELYER